MYNYTITSELMKNQQAAQVMGPGAFFRAAQQSDGSALFLSIGTDQVFYLTYETQDHSTGWIAEDFSSELSAECDGKSIQARTFSVSQNAASGELTLALAVRAEGEDSDRLFVLENCPNAPGSAWFSDAGSRNWLARPYDGGEDISDSQIGAVYLSQNVDAGLSPYLVVGIAAASTGYVQNYQVSLASSASSGVWTIFETAENYDEVLGEGIGLAHGATSTGMYSLGGLSGSFSLLFTPFEGIFGPPTVTKLTPPDQPSSLAILPVNSSNETDLYVAGNGCIQYYAADAQQSFAEGQPILVDALVSEVSGLYVHSDGIRTVLWGLNGSGQVFYASCPTGSEGNASAWTNPAPIFKDATAISSQINFQTGANEIFAHLQGSVLMRLQQDPSTTIWQERSILLPGLATDDVVEFISYTTQIAVTDTNNQPVKGLKLGLKAIGPVSIYANGLYKQLDTDKFAPLTTDMWAVHPSPGDL